MAKFQNTPVKVLEYRQAGDYYVLQTKDNIFPVQRTDITPYVKKKTIFKRMKVKDLLKNVVVIEITGSN